MQNFDRVTTDDAELALDNCRLEASMTENADPQVERSTPGTAVDAGTRAESANPDAFDGTPEAPRDELRAELESARQEATSNYDMYLRSRADMENYKKRLERTYADQSRASKKELLRRFLSVRDSLDWALQSEAAAQGPCQGLAEGVRLTRSQFDHVLSQEGVRPVDPLGKPFDPRFGEAVQTVDDPRVPEHTVVEVLRKGYTYGDENEVLRPAQVVVSVDGSAP